MSNEEPKSRSALLRAELAVARALFRLPAPVQFALSGRRPVVVDGQALLPETQLLLRLRALRGGKGLKRETPELARAAMRRETAAYPCAPVALRSVRDFEIPGAAGPLRVRHYAPDELGDVPLLVFFHGGAFIIGDLATHDDPCRLLCRHGAVHVLSVEYRLSPEHPFPAAPDDCLAAFRWAAAHATELGANPARVGVGGDSAGGNLAAVVSLVARDDGGRAPSFQILIYPATDRTTVRRSVVAFGEGFLLTREDMQWSTRAYLGDRVELGADPRVSPLVAKDHTGLAPALVATAGFDPLRDEGDAYAKVLEDAGNHVVWLPIPGVLHGFLHMASVSPAPLDAVLRIACATRELSRRTRRGIA